MNHLPEGRGIQIRCPCWLCTLSEEDERENLTIFDIDELNEAGEFF